MTPASRASDASPMATKAPAKKAATRKVAATKAPAKKAPVKKAAPVKKTPVKKGVPVKKGAPAKKVAPVKAPAKKAAPLKAVKTPAKKVTPVEKRPARARPAIGPYATDVKFLDEQRASLLSERTTYQEQAEVLKAEADSLAQEREPGDVQFDEESGEGGTVTVDRERDLVLSSQAAATVEEIEDALVRISKKTYGACERCHQPIMKARLRALPFARLCVACKAGGLSSRR